MDDRQGHWQDVYMRKRAGEVSWYRAHLERSLGWIEAAGLAPTDRIVDVGGGASTLVDDLLDRGHQAVTVLDLSDAALAQARERLGERAASVTWLAGDAREPLLAAESVALWHDRAAFHFLTVEADRAAYLDHLRRAVRPGGHVLLSTFALDGPERCSGLEVRRHSPAQLASALGDGFRVVETAREIHRTPWDSAQLFSCVWCQRDDSPR